MDSNETSTPATRSRSRSLTKTVSNVTAPLRRQTTNDRITEILDIARERQERHERQEQEEAMAASRTHGYQSETEPSADEHTGIAAYGHDLSYQTTASTGGSRRRCPPLSSQNPDPPRTSTGGVATHIDTVNSGNQREGKPKTLSWWSSFLNIFQSTELENKGSVARDHLAIERTFLAWLRTSLAFASIGIAITQLFRLNTSLQDPSNDNGGDDDDHLRFDRIRGLGKPLGSAFLGISILVLMLGYHRYSLSSQWVLHGKFPASRLTVVLVSLVSFAAMVTSLVVVVAVQPR